VSEPKDQVRAIHRRAAIIHPAAALTLATLVSLLAQLGRIHLGPLAAPIVAVRQPGLVDMAVAVGLVAILACAILATAPASRRARRAPVVVGLALADVSALPLSTGRC
jgi:hypothetical protein